MQVMSMYTYQTGTFYTRVSFVDNIRVIRCGILHQVSVTIPAICEIKAETIVCYGNTYHRLSFICRFLTSDIAIRVKITQNLTYIISKATSCTNCAVSEIKLCMYNFLVLSIAISFRFQEPNRFPSMIYLLFCRKKMNMFGIYTLTEWQ